MEEKNQQEVLFELNLIEQQMHSLHQQLQTVEHGIIELETLKIVPIQQLKILLLLK